jgi:23S rRNA pseudouridine2605 synthase
MELDDADIRALTHAANKAGALGDVAHAEPDKPSRPPERRTQNPRNRAFGAKKPDPMKTSVGYIGADSFSRQRKEQGPGGRSGGPRRNGGRSR